MSWLVEKMDTKMTLWLCTVTIQLQHRRVGAKSPVFRPEDGRLRCCALGWRLQRTIWDVNCVSNHGAFSIIPHGLLEVYGCGNALDAVQSDELRVCHVFSRRTKTLKAIARSALFLVLCFCVYHSVVFSEGICIPLELVRFQHSNVTSVHKICSPQEWWMLGMSRASTHTVFETRGKYSRRQKNQLGMIELTQPTSLTRR